MRRGKMKPNKKRRCKGKEKRNERTTTKTKKMFNKK